MALIDRDGVYGAPRFHMAAKKAGVKAHIGAEVNCVFALQKPPCGDSRPRLSSGRRPDFLYSASMSSFARPNSRGRLSPHGGSQSRLPLLASSRAGYQNLCRLITKMKLRSAKNEGAVFENELHGHAEGLICLTGGDDGPLANAFKEGGIRAARDMVEKLAQIFDHKNIYVELQRHFHREQELRNRAAIEVARSLHLPLLAANGVRYATKAARELCDVFTALQIIAPSTMPDASSPATPKRI